MLKNKILACLIGTVFIVDYLQAQCGDIIVPNDITICSSETINLDGFIDGTQYSFSWEGDNGFFDDSNLNTTDNPTSTTTYTLTAEFESSVNEILNGDFEVGNVGFTTQYDFSDPIVTCSNGNESFGPLGCEGTYLVLPNSGVTHNDFSGCSDHTTGSGNMMIVNGAPSLSEIWCQTVNVNPNTDYAFSAWATSVHPSSPAILQFSIDGILIGTDFTLNGSTCNWENFFAIWNSGGNTSIEICVTNQNLTEGGNDFALDDIFFGELCNDARSFEVTIVNLEANTPDVVNIDCDNLVAQIQVATNNVVDSYEWETIDGNFIMLGQSDLIFATEAGTYTVTVTDSNGCTATSETIVSGSNESPTGIVFGDFEISCSNPIATVEVLPDENDVTIEWVDDLGNISMTSDYSQAGSYSVVLTNIFQCIDTIFFEITSTDLFTIETPDTLTIDCDFPEAIIIATSSEVDVTYDWSTSDGMISGSSQTEQVQTMTSGTYVVTVTDTNGCTATSETYVDGNSDLPSGTISGLLELSCGISSTTIQLASDQNNISIEWIGNPGSDSTSAVYAVAGMYGVILTNDFQCSDTIPFEITLDDIVPQVVSSISPILCAGDSTELSIAVDIPIENVQWEGSNFTLVDSVSILTTESGYYTYSFEYGDGCIQNDSVLVVSLADSLSYTFSDIETLNCINLSQELSIESGNIQTIEWFDTNGSLGFDSIQVSAAGWYFAKFSDNNGCPYEDSILVSQDIVIPTFTFSVDSINCLNGIGNAVVITSNLNDFQWIDESGNTFNQDTFFTSSETNLDLIVTADNGCVDTSSVFIPASIDFPEVEFSFNDINCLLSVTELSAVSNIEGSTFEWTLPNNDMSNMESFSSPISGEYNLVVTSPEGCVFEEVFNVDIDTISPEIELVTSPITCDNPFTNIIANVQGDIMSIQWFGNEFVSLNDTLISTNESGFYSYEVVSSNGCSNIKEIEVLIDTIAPVIEVIDDITLDCIQNTVEVFVMTDGENSLDWYSNEVDFISNDPSVILDNGGSYSVNVLNPLNGCESIEIFTVALDTVPIQFDIEFNPINCLDVVSEIILISNQKINSVIASDELNAVSESTYTTDSDGFYSFILSGENGCPREKEIDVLIDTIAPQIMTFSDTLTCDGSAVTLQAQIDKDIDEVNIEWSGPNDYSENTLSPETNTAGIYNIIVVNDSNHCENNGELMIYENNTSIEYTSDLAQPVCVDDLGSFILNEVTGGTSPYEGVILNGDTELSIGSSINLTSGTYFIRLEDMNGCLVLDSFIIEERIAVNVDLGADLEIIRGDDTQLLAVSQLPDSLLASIMWTPDDNLSCDDCLDPIVSEVETNTTYQVTLTDIYGCPAVAQIEIRVSAIVVEILSPNIFSPNNDNSNDKFTLYTDEIDEVEEIESLLIYDRWGNLVYSNESFPIQDESQGWDGTFKGKPVSEGVYVFIGRVLLKNGESINHGGDITLIR